MHQSKRPSRRGAASRHPHRSSSRRNKENGSRQGSFRNRINNDILKDESGRIKKQRAVSFEQPQTTIHSKWCSGINTTNNEYKILTKQSIDHHSQLVNNDNNDDVVMDTVEPPSTITHHHYKPPRI